MSVSIGQTSCAELIQCLLVSSSIQVVTADSTELRLIAVDRFEVVIEMLGMIMLNSRCGYAMVVVAVVVTLKIRRIPWIS